MYINSLEEQDRMNSRI